MIDKLRSWLFDETREGYPLELPWMSNVKDKKIAYMVLFELPNRVADLDESYKTSRYPVYHQGLEAMKYTVEQMPRLYNEIMREYPNGRWYNPYREIHIPYINSYYAWITDRGYHGLWNAMKQFLGPNIMEDEGVPDLDEQYIARNPNSINTFLSKNFEDWNLAKFIHGYGIEYGGGDSQMDHLYYPIAFKSFRIPFQLTHYFEHYINVPARYAVSYDGAIMGLPDSMIREIKSGKFGEVLILPGNTIDPLSIGLEGIRKDLSYGKQNPVEPNLAYAESS